MDNIFYSKKVDGKWAEPINIDGQLNTSKRTVPVTISADGTELYLVSDDNDDGNIYVSTFKKGKWTSMKKLNKNINIVNIQQSKTNTPIGILSANYYEGNLTFGD